MIEAQQLDLVEYIAALRTAPVATATQQAGQPSPRRVHTERPVRSGEGTAA
ncbi:hypothetical protein NO263_13245 [Gluconacetobacter entanii]|uniref:Uncharacterized protein n=1 Tax=Gluconacetobacter entanii TaxID=108528 RepID=A0ABT3K958_9PROT|nr:hypothetical protein [Gluconacetobacter entanii]MCW4591547.1 hypothetical protein [Gluconacetobacter entanii]MCW4595409.1 hypothetical protein [Gluconacetobacter entanii]NPC89838.1 hypothetical protein [Gluconacetobacter entanii]